MNKHLIHGLIVGALFAVIITWVAALDAVEVGGLALLASVVFGLAAGLCIGALNRGELCDAGCRGKARAAGGRASTRSRPRLSALVVGACCATPLRKYQQNQRFRLHSCEEGSWLFHSCFCLLSVQTTDRR